MKKTLLLLIVCLMAININAKFRYGIFHFAWDFYTLQDNEKDKTGACHIQRDDNGVYWLLHFISSKYDDDKKKYYIPKGKHLYLKFDDDEVVTLKCELIKKISNIKIRYSFFILDNKTIDKLKTHKLIKMRSEVKDEVIDAEVVNDDILFPNSTDKAIENADKGYNEVIRQRKLKNNPLDGF